MLDDEHSEGFSPFLWYKLGQSSAEHSRLLDETADLVKRGFGPSAHAVELANAYAEISRLSLELDKANENIRKWSAHSDRVRAESTRKDAEIRRLGSLLDQREAELKAADERTSLLGAELQEIIDRQSAQLREAMDRAEKAEANGAALEGQLNRRPSS